MGAYRRHRLIHFQGTHIWLHPTWFLVVPLVAAALAMFHFPHQHPSQPVLVHVLTALVSGLLLSGSVLLHELGHVIAARQRRLPIVVVILGGLEGVTYLAQEETEPASALIVAIVGPIVHLALAGAFGALVVAGRAVQWPVSVPLWLTRGNLVLAGVNALPAFPLDGGRVLRALVWQKTGNVSQATRLSMLAGQVIGLGLMAMGGIMFLLQPSPLSVAWLGIGWLVRHKASAR